MTPNHDATHSPPPAAFAPSVGDLATITGGPPADDAPLTVTRQAGVGAGPAGGAPPPPAPPPGFVIEKELGVGGMGVVYLARQTGLNRPVALKLVKGSEKVDAKALIRFLAEAEAVAAIRHPNVVEVYSYGDHQGRPYMALEYCPNGDLTTRTKADQRRDADWFRRVAELMAGVAAGVQAAHAAGIVHRDLKPHNVFLAADGTPKVADFGLAKRGVGSDLTKTHAVMGTPAYMSPEQATGGGKFVGPEADVWALGVMLYELACGERPFDSTGQVLEALASVAKADVPPLRTKCPAVPADLALITHKCLSKDQRDRYPTAGPLAADLRNWLDGKPISARKAGVVEQAVKWAKRNQKLAGMGLAALLTMAVATGVSVGFGLEAGTQADIARIKQRDAEDERAKADAATALAEEEVGRTQLALARALLAPLSSGGNTLVSEYEQNALWELTAARRGKLPTLVYAEALRTPLSAAQFRNRAAYLDHAAVGMDRSRRREADALLAARLADPTLTADHRRKLAYGAADVEWHADGLTQSMVEVLRGELATEYFQVASGLLVQVARRLPWERELDVLLTALGESPSAGVSQTLTDVLLGTARTLPPNHATTVVRDVVSRLTAAMKAEIDANEELGLALALTRAVELLPADEAADVLLVGIRTTTTWSVRLNLADSLPTVVARLPDEEAAKVRAKWSAKLVAVMQKDLDSQELESLAVRIATAEAGPLPTPGDSRCEQAAGVLLDALDAQPVRVFETQIATALAALAARLPKDRAAAVCGAAADRILDRLKNGRDDDIRSFISSALPFIAEHLPAEEWVAKLTAAIDRATGPNERMNLDVALANVAGRLPADAATTVCRAEAKKIAAALVKEDRPYARSVAATAIAALAERMTPDDAASILLDTMDRDAKTTDRFTLAKSLLVVARRLPADRRAEVCRRAVTGLRAITERRAVSYYPQLVAELVAALAAELPTAERAKTLTEALTGTTDLNEQKVYAEELCDAASHLPPDAGAEVLIAALPQTSYWDARGNLVRGVVRVAATMPAERGATACGKAAEVIALGFEPSVRVTDYSLPAVYVARLVPQLTAEKRTALLFTAMEALNDGLARADQAYDFRYLADGLAAVATRLPDQECEKAFHRAAVAYLTAKGMDDRDPMPPFAAAVVRLTEDEYEHRRKATELAAVAGVVTLHPAVLPKPRPLPPWQLVELLKHPFCVKEARRAVLDALEFTYDRKFTDLWDFVNFAEKNTELDLLTPPKRPKRK